MSGIYTTVLLYTTLWWRTAAVRVDVQGYEVISVVAATHGTFSKPLWTLMTGLLTGWISIMDAENALSWRGQARAGKHIGIRSPTIIIGDASVSETLAQAGWKNTPSPFQVRRDGARYVSCLTSVFYAVIQWRSAFTPSSKRLNVERASG
jgi:hypothetical protein